MIGLSEKLASPGWMLSHCTPLHHEPGISWPHVIAWCVLLCVVAACMVLVLRIVRVGGNGVDDVSSH